MTTINEKKPMSFTANMTAEEARSKGNKTYNDGLHHYVDMSHLNTTDRSDWQSTIVVSLPNGLTATLCVMQTSKYSSGIDVAVTGDNLERVTVIPMGDRDDLPRIDGLINNNRNTYAVVADVRKPLERV